MNNKTKTILSIIGVALAIVLLAISAELAENAVISTLYAGIFVTVSAILLLVAISFAVKIEHEKSVYECRKCGNIFKPTLSAYIWGAHTLRTRHLKCPKCEEKSWCKRKTEV